MHMKKLEKGKFYFLKINVFGRELEYHGKVIYLDDNEFCLRTDEDCCVRFRLNDLVYFEEKEEPEKDLRIVVRKKIGKEGLKEAEKPKGL